MILPRDPILALAEENLCNAIDNVKQIAKTVQADCPHIAVLQMSHDTLRICTVCGLEENGRHSGISCWTREDFGLAALGNADHRSVREVERDKFYSYRVQR